MSYAGTIRDLPSTAFHAADPRSASRCIRSRPRRPESRSRATAQVDCHCQAPRCPHPARKPPADAAATGPVVTESIPAVSRYNHVVANGHSSCLQRPPRLHQDEPGRALAYHRQRLGLGRRFRSALDMLVTFVHRRTAVRAIAISCPCDAILTDRILRSCCHACRSRPCIVAVSSELDRPGRLQQGYVKAHYTKYEYRIPMRDGVRLFTSVYVPKDTESALPDHAQPDALQRSALRRRCVQVGPRPFAALRQRGLHRGLPGRARAVDVGGRVRQHAAARTAKDRAPPRSTRAPTRSTRSTG